MDYSKRIEEIQKLSDKFRSGEREYRSESYTEADTRSNFIDELFKCLGWDMQNRQSLYPTKREVVLENTLRTRQRPDYTFRLKGKPLFFVEAKKPVVDIKTNLDAIFQARRYGYTDEHPIVVLTNFFDLSIYDSSIPVNEDRDQAETGLMARWNYLEYPNEIDQISKYLGREHVGDNHWYDLVNSHRPEELMPAGEAFLHNLLGWRLELGESVLKSNPEMDQTELNDLVQLLINRFLFIRMCEDRGLEQEESLREAAARGSTSVSSLFAQMDDRYDTGLFSPSNAHDEGNNLWNIDGEAIRTLVDRLYAPKSPFSYAVLDADFLGRAYEQSLTQGLKIVVDDNQQKTVKLEQKSQYVHRDIVSTPQPLVDAVVKEVVGKISKDNAFPRILDFAVGSGRFLVSVYKALVDRQVINYLEKNDVENLVKVSEDNYTLAFTEKVELIKRCLFGIDIDFNAVEVARFSLIVALLEGEDPGTLPGAKKILPSINDNIVRGNSLVRPSDDDQSLIGDPVYAVDLDAIGFNNFDAVVGNPPYVSTEGMRKTRLAEFKEVSNVYHTAVRQWDEYYAFVEMGINSLSPDGVLGVVIPNKWMTVVSASQLRKTLRSDFSVTWLRNFTFHSVFEEKQIYVCGLVGEKCEKDILDYSEPESLDYDDLNAPGHMICCRNWLPVNVEDPWVLPADKNQERVLKAIQNKATKLGTIVEARNGLQTSANDVFLIRNADFKDGLVTFESKLHGTKDRREWTIEDALLIPYLDDSRRISSFKYVRSDSYLLFPYQKDSSRTSGMKLIPEQEMKESYPKTYSYLCSCRERLRDRDNGARRQMQDGGAFYAYGRGQALGYVSDCPKIFYSVNQTGDKYGLDKEGIAFQSGGTAGEAVLFPIPDSKYSLDFVLGLLAQPEIELFLRKRGSPFAGGFYARGTDVISSAPVPVLNFSLEEDRDFHKNVVNLVNNIRKLNEQMDSASIRNKDLIKRRIDVYSSQLSATFHKRWKL